jgi:hypothetical protein
MKFSEWINERFPSFDDKMNACYRELESAANVVDIDFCHSDLVEGLNKGSKVKVNSNGSNGRCRVYINRKKYDDMFFPHVVFINLRHSYQDSISGKATPSVVNSINILFDQYKNKKEIDLSLAPEKKLGEKKVGVIREVLVNEQRQWFAKLGSYSNQRFSGYFKRKGIIYSDIKNVSADIRLGYSKRYGKFAAIPLRYPNQETFQGFQRIYDTGEKIMIRDFNPNGLCAYFSPPELRESSNILLIITHEGVANALMAAKMCHELGLSVVNVGCLYEANIPIVTEIIATENKPERMLNLYDRDINEVGLTAAKKAQALYPALQIATTSRNDLCDTVRDFSYVYALREFKSILENILEKSF